MTRGFGPHACYRLLLENRFLLLLLVEFLLEEEAEVVRKSFVFLSIPNPPLHRKNPFASEAWEILP